MGRRAGCSISASCRPRHARGSGPRTVSPTAGPTWGISAVGSAIDSLVEPRLDLVLHLDYPPAVTLTCLLRRIVRGTPVCHGNRETLHRFSARIPSSDGGRPRGANATRMPDGGWRPARACPPSASLTRGSWTWCWPSRGTTGTMGRAGDRVQAAPQLLTDHRAAAAVGPAPTSAHRPMPRRRHDPPVPPPRPP